MDALHQLELAWMIILQAMTAWLVLPMRLFSAFGQEEFYMLVMPAIYWSLDAGLGIRVGMLMLFGNQVNTIAKLAVHSPRPYWLDARIKGLAAESSFGFPSNHAQNAASIWGFLATAARQAWVKTLLMGLIFFIGLSRIVLGVHFISDVIAGWAIGGLLLWLFLKIEKPVMVWLRRQSLAVMLGLSLASSLLFVALVLFTAAATQSMAIPTEWAQTALISQPAGGEIDPQNISGSFTVAGTWLGLLSGAAWLFHRQGNLKTEGTPGQRLMRYLVGAVGVFVLYYGLGSIFPRSADVLSYSLRLIRYTLIGIWISALAPLVFARLGLAQKPADEVPPLSVP